MRFTPAESSQVLSSGHPTQCAKLSLKLVQSAETKAQPISQLLAGGPTGWEKPAATCQHVSHLCSPTPVACAAPPHTPRDPRSTPCQPTHTLSLTWSRM